MRSAAWRALTLATLAMMGLAAPAAADTGAVAYNSCLTSNTGVSGCTQIPGAGANGTHTGVDGLLDLTASADGKSVYTASGASDAVATFDRDPATGALTYNGCISSDSGSSACTLIPGAVAGGANTAFDSVSSVTASADNTSVYTASGASAAVASFDRYPATGALIYKGCISSKTGSSGCTLIAGATANGASTALNDLSSVTTSADGTSVYTASNFGDAVASFDRNPATGALTYQGCISSNSALTGCTLIPGASAGGIDTGLDNLQSLATSADGENVYTASANADAVASFDRDPATGALTYDSCISSNSNDGGCTRTPGATAGGANTVLHGVVSVATSADGKSVFAVGSQSDALARFDRDPATGALTYNSCISSDANVSGCTQIAGATAGGTNTGLDQLASVAPSADNQSVYAVSGSGDALARFDRDPATGAVTYSSCISSNTDVTGCTLIAGATAAGTNSGLYSLQSVAMSPDGKSVYTGSFLADAVARFDRVPAPTPTPTPTPEPTPAPSNEFTLGKLRDNKKTGTAKLAVELPGPGMLTLNGKVVKTATTTATAAGETELTVKARGKARKKLKQHGKVKVRAQITFTPTGGLANTQPARLKLIRRA